MPLKFDETSSDMDPAYLLPPDTKAMTNIRPKTTFYQNKLYKRMKEENPTSLKRNKVICSPVGDEGIHEHSMCLTVH